LLRKTFDPGFGQAFMLCVVDHDTSGIGGVRVTNAQQSGGQQGLFEERRDWGLHAAPAPVILGHAS
jgi:hypothetical protein